MFEDFSQLLVFQNYEKERKIISSSKGRDMRYEASIQCVLDVNSIQYSDAAKLLAFYQLWLDDLFPKARFLDALAMVEKMGHKRQMQVARMEWINEGRPKSSFHEDSLFGEPAVPTGENDGGERTAPRIAPIFEKAAVERPKTPEGDVDAEMDDLYDATPRAARQPAQTEAQISISGGGSGGGSLFGPARVPIIDDGPPEDDLDALLAEEEMLQAESAKTQALSSASKVAPQESSFDDEEEAMADMDMW
jgi:replication fork protection complex subunit Csm3/Swi3